MHTAAEQSVEWQILMSICRGVDGPDEAARLRAIIERGGFRVGELLEQALRHQLLALLVHTLDGLDLWGVLARNASIHTVSRLPKQLTLCRAANARRNQALTAEAVRITAALEAAGVPVACTKGVVFQYTLYHGTGTRMLGDVDLMIRPADTKATEEVMARLGYIPGEYDPRSRSIVELSARRRMMYRVSPDHLPHHLRILDEDEAPVAIVDFAYNLTWAGSTWQVPMDEVLATRARLAVPADLDPGAELPRLSDPYAFLFAVLHLFREAWFERTMHELTLAAFTDVHRFWRGSGDAIADAVREIVARHGLHDPVRWVTGHTDTLFGTSITGALGLRAPDDDPWMRSARSAKGDHIAWRGSIQDRLYRAGAVPV